MSRREKCNHDWQPLTFVLEVRGQMPDPERGRVWLVCVSCHSHTHMDTKWVDFYLPSPEELAEEQEDSDVRTEGETP